MKKHVILIASIMFIAAGCAHQNGSDRAARDIDLDRTTAAGSMATETPDRNPDGTIRNPASTALQSDPASSFNDQAIRAEGVEPYSSARNSSLIAGGQGERDAYEPELRS